MNYSQGQDYQEEIDLYLDGLLTDREAETFEERLKSDPKLAYDLERHRIARSIIKSPSLREKLNFLSGEDLLYKQRGLFSKYKSLIKVLAAVVILVFGIFIYELFTLNNDILYQQQYSSYQIDFHGDKPPTHNSILYSFTLENYLDVINIYENKLSDSNEDILIAGISYLELDQGKKAVDAFQRIVSQAEKGGENDFLEDAEYYSGIAYLKINQIDAAYWYFSKIYHDSAHHYNEMVHQWFYWKLRIVKFRKKIF